MKDQKKDLKCGNCHKSFMKFDGDYLVCKQISCGKMFCRDCQFVTKSQFMQDPTMHVQKMAYQKDFEKISASFGDEWDESNKCTIF